MEKTITVLLVDAFTTVPGKGNRAGVVLDATGLDDGQMQAIATLVNVSETAFMIPTPDRDDHELWVRYFTPAMEVPTCGHATIGSHFARSTALGMNNGRVVARIGAGILPVDIGMENNRRTIVMTQGEIIFTPEYGETLRDEILEALGLDASDLIEGLPVQEVSTGHSKVMVPITSVERLDSLRPDMERLREISGRIACNGYFVFAFNDETDECLTSGRMFAPAAGIDEDPVTGNGNGPCGAYLSRYGRIPDAPVFAYKGRQGVTMGREGVIEVTVHRENGAPKTIQVGGTAVEAGSMEVLLTEDASGKPCARPVSS
ncbi:PhzF family phenazine biosynthesis isomerase [Salidesulfovibrio onnuriiensis]|uniref:PhzF family phenazine biosynthesis isomerase n=1 Tax=Salidesulfovibrio onnuriiensis TaxID=2583823 RepID=UPI0011CA801E|nr:PhzF family phenazine biosynthesis isomerase [Salidesulfovibrio onnuriiensis]